MTSPRSRVRSPRLVGREEELALLERALASAVEGGTTQLATRSWGRPGSASRGSPASCSGGPRRVVVGRCLPRRGNHLLAAPGDRRAARRRSMHCFTAQATPNWPRCGSTPRSASTGHARLPGRDRVGRSQAVRSAAAAAHRRLRRHPLGRAGVPRSGGIRRYVRADVLLFVLCTARPELFESAARAADPEAERRRCSPSSRCR